MPSQPRPSVGAFKVPPLVDVCDGHLAAASFFNVGWMSVETWCSSSSFSALAFYNRAEHIRHTAAALIRRQAQTCDDVPRVRVDQHISMSLRLVAV